VIVIAIMGNEGTYQLLILSQVILSLQLPFAIVPMIRFSSDKTLMKKFVNPIWVTVLSWCCALLIISLNVWVVGESIGSLFTYSDAIKAVGSLLLLVVLSLWLLLLYLAIRGVVPIEKWKDNLVYFVVSKC